MGPCCGEPSITVLARKGPAAAEALAARLAAPAAEIAPSIPQAVALGYHGCFGTRYGWPSRQPTDLSGAVIVLNAMVAASGRRVDFLHLPTLGSAADSFFALLARLTAPIAKVYPGAIHPMDDSNGFRRHCGRLGGISLISDWSRPAALAVRRSASAVF